MPFQVEASPKDVRKVMMRGRKVAAWKRLRLPERDVLTVLTAICKVLSSLAGRELGLPGIYRCFAFNFCHSYIVGMMVMAG